MKKIKKRIYIQQWLDLKPYEKQVPTDSYYLELCNEVNKSILAIKESLPLYLYLDTEEIEELSCFLTSYFEDLISETNIWNTFIRLHKKLYGKYVPFYKVNEYYEKEINIHDICFLIWYYMNALQEDKVIAPFNDFIVKIADAVFDVFNDSWEYAPENESLKAYYTIDETETDYYEARNLIDTVLFKSYLFHPDTNRKLRYTETEIMEDSGDDENILNFLNENRDELLHNLYTCLLALKGQEWVAELLGEDHALSKDYQNISPRIRAYFLYKGQDHENIFLEHIATGMKFNLTKESFEYGDSLTEIDTVVYIGIVRWRSEWWFSGVYVQTKFDADLVLDERNSAESRSAVDFLNHQDLNVDDYLANQLNAFKAFNNNEQIAFMEMKAVEPFMKNYIEFFNNSLTLTQKEKDEASQKARKDGFFGNEHTDFPEVSENGLVFFNPKQGPEVAMAVNSAFPMKNNPFYNEIESEQDIISLFFSADYSVELAMYCIDNFKDDLEFLKSPEGALYLDNIDFLFRFWKRSFYYTKPAMFIIGKDL